jgi:hypothetical protein
VLADMIRTRLAVALGGPQNAPVASAVVAAPVR